MAATKRAGKNARGRKKKSASTAKPTVPKAVLNRTKAMIQQNDKARKNLDLHLKKIGAYLHRLKTHQHFA